MPQSKPIEKIWLQHIRAWRNSQLSQAAYCQQKNLKYHQFTYWKIKLDEQPTESVQPTSAGFATVALNSSSTADGLQLTFPSGIRLSGIQSAHMVVVRELLEVLK